VKSSVYVYENCCGETAHARGKTAGETVALQTDIIEPRACV